MGKAFDYAPSSTVEVSRAGGTLTRRRRGKRVRPVLAVFALTAIYFTTDFVGRSRPPVRVPLHAASTLAKCRFLSAKPASPPGFSERTQYDRYEPGITPVLIRNASIWTGRHDGRHVVHGDILLENGLIKTIGNVNALLSKDDPVDVVDAEVSFNTIKDCASSFG